MATTSPGKKRFVFINGLIPFPKKNDTSVVILLDMKQNLTVVPRI